ncbi:MFS transporter [Paraburkholderia sp. Cy-641]|uniref:MFS transporter n=1 Tax=Paraburkholderia sp. Cy-641 TaxID=2608337 RepID=UPI0014239FBA|nr:MFS transporter [Paraburkholderia sp. Cy-641]NIF77334.1 MFS transporter [Paraburkholderia sp. Cy-641]
MKTVLVDDLIDERPFGLFQASIFAICFLIALMDGANVQVMGLSAPLLANDLKLTPAQLGPIFAGSELGFMIGALLLGPVADRIGRKTVLIACASLFGLASLCTVTAPGFVTLLVLRIVTGIGLGGAAPCLVSLTTEYVSRRHRGRIASLLWAAMPAGGVIAGFAASIVTPQYGWRAMFYLSGIVPIAAAVLVWLFVPESVRLLILSGARDDRIARIVRHLAPSSLAGEPVRYATHEHQEKGLPVKHLFVDGRAPLTALLWLAFFLNFLALIATLAWASTLLRSAAMSVAAASTVLAWNNVGGTIGVAIAGAVMERLGTCRFLAAIYALGAIVLALTGFSTPNTALVSLCSGLTGLFVGGATSGLIAIASMTYPTAIRSTGVGWALAAGRLGGAVGPVAVGALVATGLPVAHIFVATAAPMLGASLVMLAMSRLGAARTVDRAEFATH